MICGDPKSRSHIAFTSSSGALVVVPADQLRLYRCDGGCSVGDSVIEDGAWGAWGIAEDEWLRLARMVLLPEDLVSITQKRSEDPDDEIKRDRGRGSPMRETTYVYFQFSGGDSGRGHSANLHTIPVEGDYVEYLDGVRFVITHRVFELRKNLGIWRNHSVTYFVERVPVREAL